MQTFSRFRQCLITKIETKLDYYQQKVNAQVASIVAERLTTYHLSKLGNFEEIPEMLDLMSSTQVTIQKANLYICPKEFQ